MFFRNERNHIKNLGHSGVLSEEVEGIVQGHRDGHGFVLRDDGDADIYLPPNEMRAVLHKDRVKARVVRQELWFDGRTNHALAFMEPKETVASLPSP